MPNSLDPRSPSLHTSPERTALVFGLGHLLQPLACILGTLPGQRAAHPQPSSSPPVAAQACLSGPLGLLQGACQGDSGHGALPGWSRVLVPSLDESDSAFSRLGLLTTAPSNQAAEATLGAPGARPHWPWGSIAVRVWGEGHGQVCSARRPSRVGGGS